MITSAKNYTKKNPPKNGHTDGQQTHEKKLKNTNHQRNANQNYNEILPHT